MTWDDKSSWRVPKRELEEDQDDLAKMFSENRGAMVSLRLMEVEEAFMRDMESPYGIVPMPKLDEVQTEYHSHPQGNNDIFTIPLTTTGDRLDMATAVMEAMASEGYRTLEPAYYEVALKSKYVSDEESVKMLDLVIENLHVDFGFLYVDGTAGFHQNMRLWVGNNTTNIASSFAANERIIKKRLEKLNQDIAAIQ